MVAQWIVSPLVSVRPRLVALTGSREVWLSHTPWARVVVGSNPTSPTYRGLVKSGLIPHSKCGDGGSNPSPPAYGLLPARVPTLRMTVTTGTRAGESTGSWTGARHAKHPYGGQWFPPPPLAGSSVVECCTVNAKVVGSIPTRPAFKGALSSLVMTRDFGSRCASSNLAAPVTECASPYSACPLPKRATEVTNRSGATFFIPKCLTVRHPR